VLLLTGALAEDPTSDIFAEEFDILSKFNIILSVIVGLRGDPGSTTTPGIDPPSETTDIGGVGLGETSGV